MARARVHDIGNVGLPPEHAPARRRVIHQTAAVGGKFYSDETGKLGVIEFSPEPAFGYLDYPHAGFPDESNCAGRLVLGRVGRRDLFKVSIYLLGLTPEILTARVHKFDLSGQILCECEVGDLDDRVLLLSYPNAQLLCSASKYGLKGNRIYVMHI